jgi:potassium inwardly-rectifying channel subfamily J
MSSFFLFYFSRYDTVLKSKRGLNFNRKARLIGKNGDCHVNRRHINFLTRSCISDVFSSLVDMKWRYSILLFFMSYVASWIVFACIWWLVAVTHDDTSHSADDSSWTSCVNHVTNFKSALLFSVETQHTIGL